ncbi:MAG: HAD family hydrolase [Schwartzia sp.]|nr:HAD family hydrolase [Schwartzia sp. (in: firmicutes)]
MGNKKARHGAIFFDWDGTLNVDKDYLYKIEEFEWLEDAPQAIRFANEQGVLVIVVTNQSGVARGYFVEDDVRRLHEWMNEDLTRFGAHIDAFYYCPHLPSGSVAAYAKECDCRKPKPGLIEQACADFDIDRGESLLIGDKARDVECAEAAGVRGILYTGGSLLELLKQTLGQKHNTGEARA